LTGAILFRKKRSRGGGNEGSVPLVGEKNTGSKSRDQREVKKLHGQLGVLHPEKGSRLPVESGLEVPGSLEQVLGGGGEKDTSSGGKKKKESQWGTWLGGDKESIRTRTATKKTQEQAQAKKERENSTEWIRVGGFGGGTRGEPWGRKNQGARLSGGKHKQGRRRRERWFRTRKGVGGERDLRELRAGGEDKFYGRQPSAGTTGEQDRKIYGHQGCGV